LADPGRAPPPSPSPALSRGEVAWRSGAVGGCGSRLAVARGVGFDRGDGDVVVETSAAGEGDERIEDFAHVRFAGIAAAEGGEGAVHAELFAEVVGLFLHAVAEEDDATVLGKGEFFVLIDRFGQGADGDAAADVDGGPAVVGVAEEAEAVPRVDALGFSGGVVDDQGEHGDELVGGAFGREVLVESGDGLSEWGAAEQQCFQVALDDGHEQSGAESFAGDVAEEDGGSAVVEGGHGEEVAGDVASGGGVCGVSEPADGSAAGGCEPRLDVACDREVAEELGLADFERGASEVGHGEPGEIGDGCAEGGFFAAPAAGGTGVGVGEGDDGVGDADRCADGARDAHGHDAGGLSEVVLLVEVDGLAGGGGPKDAAADAARAGFVGVDAREAEYFDLFGAGAGSDESGAFEAHAGEEGSAGDSGDVFFGRGVLKGAGEGHEFVELGVGERAEAGFGDDGDGGAGAVFHGGHRGRRVPRLAARSLDAELPGSDAQSIAGGEGSGGAFGEGDGVEERAVPRAEVGDDPVTAEAAGAFEACVSAGNGRGFVGEDHVARCRAADDAAGGGRLEVRGFGPAEHA